MGSRRRLAAALAGALAFGLFAAWAKGPAGDAIGTLSQLRSVLGNVSTPWLLVAFLAGAQARRLRSGALLGLAATCVALGAFYALTTLLIRIDLRTELVANRAYFEGGLVTGLVFGALGAWWARRRTLSATVVAGALMMAEPVTLALIGATGLSVIPASSGLPLVVRVVPGWGLTSGWPALQLAVYAAEFATGAALVALALRPRLRLGRAA
jgi:hypothetical protein